MKFNPFARYAQHYVLAPTSLIPPTRPDQDWYTFASEVFPHPIPDNFIILYTGLPPFTALIDLSLCDSNDRFLLREEVLLDSTPGYPGDDTGDDRKWHRLDEHTLGIGSVNGRRMLMVDDTPTTPSVFAVIQPMPGPWVARLTICQTAGIHKTTRFLLF